MTSTSVVLAEPPQWEAGVQVVLSAQARTGLPDPSVWPPGLLAAHTRERQAGALRVWLALVGGTAVGHALIQRVPPGHRDWSLTGDVAVDRAIKRGTLVEMGGLAVAAPWHGQGVAGELVNAQIAWVRQQPELLLVASIWEKSPGSNSLARRYARRLRCGATGPYSLFVYDV